MADATSRFVAAAACALLCAGCKKDAPAPPPQDRLTVAYSVDRETLRVGDPVELVVTAWYPTNATVALPEIGRGKEVVLLRREWKNVPRTDGLAQTETRYTLTSFRLGRHAVSTNPITYSAGGESFATTFPAVVLAVESSLGADASTELADLKPPHKLPGRVPRWLWIAPATALLAFLAGWLSSRLWKNRAALVPAPPPEPPHVAALRALDALARKGLLERDECEPFYTELSLILRTYLEGRFLLNAPDETTEEIVEEMSRSPELDGSRREILQAFMRQADMVKFAKGRPGRAAMEAAFETARRFVEETKVAGEATAQIGNRKSEIGNS